jgi:hypothetical protein
MYKNISSSLTSTITEVNNRITQLKEEQLAIAQIKLELSVKHYTELQNNLKKTTTMIKTTAKFEEQLQKN